MAATPPFLDPGLPPGQRIADLLGRLTLPEKISQLVHDSKAVERVGVPAYNWWNEACHGVGRNGRATVFPQVIGLAATWNRQLVQRVASTIADEARAKHHAAVREGRRGQYQGLTFWTPNINIFRDPRWGRGQETFGEDPFLTGELGAAMVRGLQGDHAKYMKVAACAKHFAVHSGPEQERHGFDAKPTPKDFAETYLPAFKKLVDTGVESVMGAYNRTLGEPCCGSKLLLVDILRKKWGFQGHVVSDCGAIDDFHVHHKVTKTAAESAALAVRNGCDLNCGCTYNDLVIAVKDGLITEAEIDTALGRLLATRFKLGLLDPQDQVPWSNTSVTIIDSEPHRRLAREAAAESMVLLKNNGVLPLRKDADSILVIGPTAANTLALIGNYYGFSSRLITIAEGIFERAAEHCRTQYRMASPLCGPMAPGINYTYGTAAENEIVVAVMGIDSSYEGEEGDTPNSPGGGDRQTIELPKVQLDMLLELRKTARKLVVVITGGSAIAIPEVHEVADAVLYAWYPGCEGGRAVADVLFGDVAPSGKLPVTVPHRTADLPPFNDYGMKGRTYRFAEIEPLYPFGFGLGYAKFAYGPLELTIVGAGLPATVSDRLPAGSSKSILLKQGETVAIRTTLQNLSDTPASEAVQCYVQPPRSWPNAPRATLVDFQKVTLPARGQVTVEFKLPASAFAQVDAAGNPARVPGDYGIVVGSASPGPRAVALGAPAPATATVTVA